MDRGAGFWVAHLKVPFVSTETPRPWEETQHTLPDTQLSFVLEAFNFLES